MEKLYSCKTASEHYSYSVEYFRRLVKLKLIDYEKIGTAIRFKQSILDQHFTDKIKSLTKDK